MGLAVAVLFALTVLVGCDRDVDEKSRGKPRQDSRASAERTRAPSEEYRVARAIRGFLTALFEGDGEAACRRLSPEQQAAARTRLKRPSCERAIRLQALSMREADIERLGRARVSRVALKGAAGTAEVVTPARKGGVPEPHTVRVERIDGEWLLASNFFPGALRGGKAPRPPPPPPPNPAEERKIRAVFERFRAALNRGDGRAACALRTRAARRAAVSQAIDAAGGRRAAIRDYGELSCAAVSAGLRIPDEKVERITVESGRGRLTLENGATYGFRLLERRWKLDS